MAKLIYSMLTSLDGYTEDEHGQFGWGAPEDASGGGMVPDSPRRPKDQQITIVVRHMPAHFGPTTPTRTPAPDRMDG